MTKDDVTPDRPQSDVPPPEDGEAPEIFAVNQNGPAVQFTRRNFLQVAMATAATAALAGCNPGSAPSEANGLPSSNSPAPTDTPLPSSTTTPSQTPTHTPTLTKTPTKTATVTRTSTRTPTLTPTPLTIAKPSSSIRVRRGPGTNYDVIGGLAGGEEVAVIGRNDDGSWLRIEKEGLVGGWVKASLVTLSTGAVNDLRVVTPMPTPTPMPGRPGTTAAGEDGSDYTYTDEAGNVVHYTLPCGSEIPPGSVCVCNCVSVPAPCTCDAYTRCSCDQVCTCDSVCSCVGAHYWYPN